MTTTSLLPSTPPRCSSTRRGSMPLTLAPRTSTVMGRSGLLVEGSSVRNTTERRATYALLKLSQGVGTSDNIVNVPEAVRPASPGRVGAACLTSTVENNAFCSGRMVGLTGGGGSFSRNTSVLPAASGPDRVGGSGG